MSNKIIITTQDMVEGTKVADYLGIVFAEAVGGDHNPDETVKKEVTASFPGADAVVGLKMSVSNWAAGTSYCYVGTAVKLEPTDP